MAPKALVFKLSDGDHLQIFSNYVKKHLMDKATLLTCAKARLTALSCSKR